MLTVKQVEGPEKGLVAWGLSLAMVGNAIAHYLLDCLL
jgi:hypothetical protein